LARDGVLPNFRLPDVAATAGYHTGDTGMRAALRTGLAATLLGVVAGSAGADMAVYHHVGSWDAFSGPGTDGKPVCGIGSTNPVDNRAFSLRFPIGGDTVLLQAKKPSWNIPAGTQLQVIVQIGLEAPWTFQGVGNGQTVEWVMDRNAIQTFDAQFRRGNSMRLTFPTGNEPPWTIGLNGSTAISNTFGRCVTDLAQQAAPEQAAPAPSGPTQPFGAEPPAPATQEPTQPAPR
jgi:hypothetical protein